MNYLMLLVAAQLALANLGNIKPNSSEWESYKLEHGKSYDNHEDSLRSLIFAHNKHKVEQFNSKQKDSSFKMGLNHLSDLSESELKVRNGFRLPKNHEELLTSDSLNNKFLLNLLSDDSTQIPDEVDWRRVPGRVSGVKDQGHCGSCWSFATTGVLEGQEKKLSIGKNGSSFDMVELSEQNLLDCDEIDAACGGGNPYNALNYINGVGGIDTEASYPYEGRKGKCRFDKSKVVITDTGATILPSNDEQALKEVVAKFGPVSVAIDADHSSFSYYQSGIYYEEKCKSAMESLNHAVLVVGYGTDPHHGDYWIVKNSWGAQYGESGYVRMARNRGNNCGIATMPIIPTFSS